MNNQYYGAPIGQEYNPGNHQYYQPAAPQQYGSVYYGQAPPDTSYEHFNRTKGFEALDRLFGDIKNKQFDTSNFPAIQQRLSELSGLQLPTIEPTGIPPAYQPVAGGDMPPTSALPPMGNAKSREDLTSIDRILEQMSNAVYDNDVHSGANYVNYNTHYGRSQPAAPPNAMTGIAAQALPVHQNGGMSEQSSNAALTPPSSAQSYTSGHSPLPNHLHLQGSSSAQMYPSLPTSAGMDGQYPTGAGHPPTLGPTYGDDSQIRRYSGGMLQRAQPVRRGDVDAITSDGSITPPATAAKKASPPAAVIDPNLDPALSGESPTKQADTNKPVSTEVEMPSDETTTTDEPNAAPDGWLETTRFIEYVRDLIRTIKNKIEKEPVDEEVEGKEEEAIRQLQNHTAAAEEVVTTNHNKSDILEDQEMTDAIAPTTELTPKLANATASATTGGEVEYPKLNM